MTKNWKLRGETIEAQLDDCLLHGGRYEQIFIWNFIFRFL